jgi:phosphoribosyl 1,2-cyclic phosphodiesterase
VELVDEATGGRLLLDAGTGIVGCTATRSSERTPLTVLLSHYHWDHVQGLPFVDACYREGEHVEVLGPVLASTGPDAVETLFAPPYFPLPFDRLPSKPAVSSLPSGTFQAGGFSIDSAALNHPGGSLAYRIAGTSGDLVYATDHEFGDPACDEALASFAAGASAIILDAHGTPEELPAMKGWGHGSWDQCARLAARAGVARLWLFHHKPGRSDREVVAIERAAQAHHPGARAAREGVEFAL